MDDLTTPENVANYMQQAISEEDWNRRCDNVKRENGNDYPSFWYATIVLSGLAARVIKTWGKQ